MAEPAGRSWELGLGPLGSSLSSAAITWDNSRISRLYRPILLHYRLALFQLGMASCKNAARQIERACLALHLLPSPELCVLLRAATAERDRMLLFVHAGFGIHDLERIEPTGTCHLKIAGVNFSKLLAELSCASPKPRSDHQNDSRSSDS